MAIHKSIVLGLLTCLLVIDSAKAAALPSPWLLVPPDPLPECAPADELKWQPVLDYDKDGCYNVAAIGADGRISKGLPLYYSVPANCRDERDSEWTKLQG